MDEILSGAEISSIRQLLQGPLFFQDPDAPAAIARLAELPLHCKNVSRIDLDGLSNLPSNTVETADRWRHARGWLDDFSRYAAVPRSGAAETPHARLSNADIRRLVDAGVVEETSPDNVRGHVHVFAVPEFFKNRRRPIKNPAAINETLGKDTLMTLDMATKCSIIELVLKGNFAISFDFASYFDQFSLNKDIANLQCFRKGKKIYRLCSGAMGQRQMVEVAHTATKKLADVPGRESVSEVIIDNVIYVGERDQLLRDGAAFVERVRSVRGTLNEDTTDLDRLIVQRGEWGGVAFDLERKTTWLTDKIINKIKLSWARRAEWSYRNLLAHYGLLFWALGILDVSPGDHYAALRFYSHLCMSFAAAKENHQEPGYDEPAVVWPTALQALGEWTAAVLANKPRQLAVKHDVVWRMCTDACRFGWGYVAMNEASGEIRTHGAQWGSDFVQRNRAVLHRSTFTEPEAVVASCCHLLARNGTRQRIVVGTDNIPTKCNGNKGFSARSFAQNECRARLRRLFPPGEFDFDFRYVPGDENIYADELSRKGKIASEDKGQIALGIARLLGDDRSGTVGTRGAPH